MRRTGLVALHCAAALLGDNDQVSFMKLIIVNCGNLKSQSRVASHWLHLRHQASDLPPRLHLHSPHMAGDPARVSKMWLSVTIRTKSLQKTSTQHWWALVVLDTWIILPLSIPHDGERFFLFTERWWFSSSKLIKKMLNFPINLKYYCHRYQLHCWVVWGYYTPGSQPAASLRGPLVYKSKPTFKLSRHRTSTEASLYFILKWRYSWILGIIHCQALIQVSIY